MEKPPSGKTILRRVITWLLTSIVIIPILIFLYFDMVFHNAFYGESPLAFTFSYFLGVIVVVITTRSISKIGLYSASFLLVIILFLTLDSSIQVSRGLSSILALTAGLLMVVGPSVLRKIKLNRIK